MLYYNVVHIVQLHEHRHTCIGQLINSLITDMHVRGICANTYLVYMRKLGVSFTSYVVSCM